ncbi:acyl-CoA dehydrogenase, partial [Mycobacterium sp. ITM-2017-0098]
DIVNAIGNDQQQHWASLMIERNWGATMVLTEPDAGSDVGAGRTKAIQQADGTWHLDGVKRFITNGDADDLFENIVHMVLARPEG